LFLVNYKKYSIFAKIITMELKKYTDEQFARYDGAVGILGKAVGICGFLFAHTTDENEKDAILSFLRKYAIMRNQLSIEDDNIIQYAFDEVQPLIAGDTPLLNLEYILNSHHVGVAV
jgi:hypothetical protein